MRILFVIVISILVMLGMVVEASINRRVHSEYLRRLQAPSQFRFHEPPAGVHAEYIRRRIYGQSEAAIKIPHYALPAREHRRQSTSSVRQHLRHQQRSRYNI